MSAATSPASVSTRPGRIAVTPTPSRTSPPARPLASPGVADAGAVAGLVGTDRAFPLQYRDRRMWTVEQELAGDGQPDDPRADDDVLLAHAEGSVITRNRGMAAASIARQS